MLELVVWAAAPVPHAPIPTRRVRHGARGKLGPPVVYVEKKISMFLHAWEKNNLAQRYPHGAARRRMYAGLCQPAAVTGELRSCFVADRRLRRRVADNVQKRLVRRARALHGHRSRTASRPRNPPAESCADRGRVLTYLIEMERC